jgi:iron-sulfur cluster assembly accessory protein
MMVSIYLLLGVCVAPLANGWVMPSIVPSATTMQRAFTFAALRPRSQSAFVTSTQLFSSTEAELKSTTSSTDKSAQQQEEIPYDYVVPEDAVIHIKPMAMRRLRELRSQQKAANDDSYMVLRMGVRSGGCSGMSYVMDFASPDDAVADDDQIDTYESDKIQCIVDAKSMLYLYGLELDYSTELIGGGFRFFNPNAEESCGCGSSFGV